jgi:hypothetical protein
MESTKSLSVLDAYSPHLLGPEISPLSNGQKPLDSRLTSTINHTEERSNRELSHPKTRQSNGQTKINIV